MICFDTNIIIAYFNRRPARMAERFEREVESGLVPHLSVVVIYELLHGARTSARPDQNLERIRLFLESSIQVLPFDLEDARHASDILAHLKRRGALIGHYDILIAAQARARGATLIAANIREYARVPDLRLEDWSV